MAVRSQPPPFAVLPIVDVKLIRVNTAQCAGCCVSPSLLEILSIFSFQTLPVTKTKYQSTHPTVLTGFRTQSWPWLHKADRGLHTRGNVSRGTPAITSLPVAQGAGWLGKAADLCLWGSPTTACSRRKLRKGMSGFSQDDLNH